MDVKRTVKRNGFKFYFYDNYRNDDVQTMLDYMFYLETHVRLVLNDKVLIVVDSNMRNAFNNYGFCDRIKDLAVHSESKGGRCAKEDLMSLFPEIVQYRRVLVCVGNKDFNSTSEERILKYYTDLVENLPHKHHVLFFELLPRMDHAEYSSTDVDKFSHSRLQAFNKKMKEKLADIFYPNKHINPCHFRKLDKCHLDDFGQQKLIQTVAKYAGMMLDSEKFAYILSVIDFSALKLAYQMSVLT